MGPPNVSTGQVSLTCTRVLDVIHLFPGRSRSGSGRLDPQRVAERGRNDQQQSDHSSAGLVGGRDRLLTGYRDSMGIDDVLARHRESLVAVPGVVGVGVTERGGQPAVLVMLSRVTPESKALPEEIDGYPVLIEVTGEIAAFSGA